jgi:hypothetical protein
VSGDKAANERKPEVAQEDLNYVDMASPRSQVELTEADLTLIVGGNSDPTDPVGNGTDPVDESMKATPILF